MTTEGAKFADLAMEVDIEYDNGFRETVTIKLDQRFVTPFDGKIVGKRLVAP